MGFALRGLSRDSFVVILPQDHLLDYAYGYKSVPTNEMVAVARESNNPINKTVVSHYGATQGAPTGVQIADNAVTPGPEPLDNAFVVNLITFRYARCVAILRGVCFPTLWLFVESLVEIMRIRASW